MDRASTISSEAAAKRASTALLALICVGQFMVVLDVSIVNVALPSIRSGLHFSTTGLQWVVNAYTLTFAGFLMLGGRAADLLGRRRVFLAGAALFTIASLGCAVAHSQGLLIAARSVQGMGGAILSPATLAIIMSCFPEGRERNRALGAWGAMAGLGGSSGALLGGLLTQGFSWEAIFLVNVPIGAALVLTARRIVPEGRSESSTGGFDVLGSLLVTAGLAAVAYGIVASARAGWGSAQALGSLLGGIGLIGLFVLVEGRVARAPLVPLEVFRRPLLRGANIIIFLLYGGMFSMWFFISLYLQGVLRYGVLATGALFLPMTLGVVAGSTLAPRILRRIAPWLLLVLGMLICAAGMALFTSFRAGGSYLTEVLPGGVLMTVGLGLALVPSTIIAVQGVPRAQSGLASGLVNTARLMGGAVGLAVLTTIADTRTHDLLRGGARLPVALAEGYSLASGVAAGIVFAGAIVALVLLRPRRTPPQAELAQEADPAGEPALA